MADNILMMDNKKLSLPFHILILDINIFKLAENILQSATNKQTREAAAKENAHFVFCPTLLPEKIQKEHSPSLFLTSPKKE